MQYFYTYHMYYDCPTCDSFSDEVYLSEAFTSDIDLIADIGNYVNNNLFLHIHSLDTDGTITKVADVESSYGFHKIGSLMFTLNGFTYMWNWIHEKQRYSLTTNNEQYNLIYGEEN